MLEPSSPTAIAGAGTAGMRACLRHETRTAHDTVETLYEQHDIATHTGLVSFLKAHAVALDWCLSQLPASEPFAITCLRRMRAAIDSDLFDLETRPQPSASPPVIGHAPHALGMIYVVAGSRLGARVLLKQLKSSDDERVRGASDYLTCMAGDLLWRDTKKRLDAWQGPATEKADILAAARLTFEWFGVALGETD